MALSRKPNGQSVVEVLIAVVILALLTTASFVLLATSFSESLFAGQRAQAENLLTEGREAVRQIRDRQFDLLVAGSHGLALVGSTWTFSGTEDVTASTFTRSVTVTSVDDNTRDVTVEISWESRPGRSITVDTTERVTNWRGLEVWGNWGVPQIVGAEDLDPTAEGTGVSLLGSHVYLSATANSNRPRLYVFDVSNPANPVRTDAEITADDFYGVVTVDEANVAYTIGGQTNNQLRVWDVSNPSAITQVTTRSLNALGYVLWIDGTYLYAGAANGLRIFDITNPSAPTLVTAFNPGTEARGVTVIDTYAYLATPHDGKELLIVDISNPASPNEVGSYDLSGSVDGLSVAARGNKLYLGRYNNSSSNPEIYIFDRTNPTAPTLLKSIDYGGDVNSMIPAGPYLFTAGNVSNREFTIYRVTDPLNPTIEASLNMSNIATGLDLVDNTMYISLRSNDAFQIIQPTP